MSVEILDNFCDSRFWDLNTTWNTDNPDFTPCFKKTVLVWIPCLFLWILTPLQAHYLWISNGPRLPFNLFNITKLISIFLIIMLTISDLINLIYIELELTYYIYSLIIKLITFVLAYGLTWWNIATGIKSSGILFSFTFFEVIFGLPQFRNVVTNLSDPSFQNKTEYFNMSFGLYYILIIILFILNCFSDSERRAEKSLKKKKKYCPSKDASFVSNLFLNWFNEYVWKSRREQIDDLWNVDEKESCIVVLEKFEKIGGFNIGVKKSSSKELKITAKFLYLTLMKMFYSKLLVPFAWKFVDAVITLVYPLLLSSFLLCIIENQASWRGYLYAVVFVFLGVIQAIASTKYYITRTKTEALVEGTLTGIIYKKTIHISNSLWRQYTTSDIVNLMSVDVNAVLECLRNIDNFWVCIMNVIVIFYFLWTMLGYSVLVGVVITLFIFPINHLLSQYYKVNQMKEMEKKDIRTRFVQELICGIKILKMYAWEDDFEKQAQRVRDDEVAYLRRFIYFQGINLFMFVFTPVLLTASIFGVYVLSSSDHVLDIQKAFVSIAYINVFKTSFQLMPVAIINTLRAKLSIERIAEFLNSEEKMLDAISYVKTDESVTIIDGTFSWNNDENAVLKDINMHVKPGELVAVIGSVGAGKSSLITALLGEMYTIAGTVNINKDTVGYVPQQAWILNRSLKDNITLNDPIDDSFYQQVIDACALREDLAMLPYGDATQIGEKGINLSGGQKQRVSLARSICRNEDAYFFDDPLSAVDYNVAKHIFDHVLGPNGLLKDKTRIFVTHNITFLPQTDYVYVLKDGRITESGTYHDLINKDGDFADYIKTYANELAEDENSNEIEIICDRPELRKKKSSKIICEENKEIQSNTKNFIDDEYLRRGQMELTVYTTYLKAVGIGKSITSVIFALFYQIFSVLGILWLAIWTMQPFGQSDQSNILSNQTFCLVIFILLGLSEATLFLISVIIICIGVVDASSTLFSRLLAKILRWPMWQFDTTPLGRIINRFNIDVFKLDCVICAKITVFLMLLVKMAAVIIAIIVVEPLCLIAIIPILIIISITQFFFAQSYDQLNRLCAINRSPVFSFHIETMNGLLSIRAFGIQDKFFQYIHEKIDAISTSTIAQIVCLRWLGIRVEILGTFITFFTTIIIMSERSTLSVALIAFAMSYAIQTTKEMTYTLNFGKEVQTSLLSVEKIQEYIDLPVEEEETAIPFSQVPSNWPQRGEIIFENYQSKYRKTPDLVLRGLSFSIKSGEKVGIVGRTGAGKSSLILALFQIIETCGGRILIDGVDISTISLKILRSRLTVIPQDPITFMGTLRFNLDPTGKHSDDNLWKALTKSHLKEFVASLPGGLDFKIEEGGANFSFGQRQLLCLARALLRKTKILTLDEATASVDLMTDELIQNTIRTEFADCTVLTIAHRINTVQDYDKIMVIDDGRVAEFDTPNNLFKLQDSIFYKLAHEAGLA